jgi:hypothetical protein
MAPLERKRNIYRRGISYTRAGGTGAYLPARCEYKRHADSGSRHTYTNAGARNADSDPGACARNTDSDTFTGAGDTYSDTGTRTGNTHSDTGACACDTYTDNGACSTYTRSFGNTCRPDTPGSKFRLRSIRTLSHRETTPVTLFFISPLDNTSIIVYNYTKYSLPR